ncbi:hypothetical protein KSF_086910 [Reticulibacter mediterranei]|uniref:Peptidase C51 domain-containing protein n=1 Tax=Reticulibacter mediterranei TaxID=2778369 RepID=A0A8J3IQZ4_9CHLR|nr:hypothetical protein KSF_086910 [Reticulibacter mediterranei]
MLKLRKTLATLGLLSCLIGCFLSFSPPASAASAQPHGVHYCQCTEYVNSYYHMSVPGNAYQWKTELPGYGWQQESSGTIRVGDIAVWGTNFSTYGHLAIVNSISGSSAGATITFLGANQDGSRFTSLNCNDVSYWSTPYYWSLAVYFHH